MTSVYSQSMAHFSMENNAVTVAQVRTSKERSLAILSAREKERKYQLDHHFDNCKRKIDLAADLEMAALEAENFQQIDQNRASIEHQFKQTVMLTEYGAAESVLNLEYTALSLNLHAKISALERKKAKLASKCDLKFPLIDWEIIAPVGPVHVALQQATLQSQHEKKSQLNQSLLSLTSKLAQ